MLKYPHGEESGKETKDTQRVRDTRTHKKRFLEEPQENRQINAQQPEEEVTQTSLSPRSGDCISKRTRLGRKEA
jgi:hypothetical protein